MSEWPPSTPEDNPNPGWRDLPGEAPPLPPAQVPPTQPQPRVSTGDVPSWDHVADLPPFEPVVVSPPTAPPGADPSPVSNTPRRIGKIVAAGVGVVLLTGVGFAAGAQFADDNTNSDPITATQLAAASDEADTNSAPETATEAPTEAQEAEIPVRPGPVIDDEAEPVAAVAAAVAPSVVRIDTGSGTGSGIIYDESGLIVTNAHVIGEASQVTIQLADGTRAEGEVIGADPSVDIAVLQIDADLEFEVAIFAPTRTVETGQLAVAIGSPFGLDQSVTGGYISAVNRAIANTNVADGTPTVVEMLQTDAPINPGNSGGALADRQGRVVGVNTSIRTDGTTQGNLGVGFAIPSDTAILVAGRIVNGESLESGFLGVSGQDPLTGSPGALITEVVVGGPAEAAGLSSGDLIVSVDGEPVDGMTELAAKVRLATPGTVVTVQVLRDGAPAVLEVTLGTLGQG
ncbi:MAG: S1C family serine protease [Acidimicrobiales bacterium]